MARERSFRISGSAPGDADTGEVRAGSKQDVDSLRQGYEAGNRGDIDAVVGVMDPEIEWWGHPQLPEPGPLHGREEVRRWLEETRDALSDLEVVVQEMIDTGDQIVAIVRLSGRGKGSGAPVAGGPDAHVWTMRNGKAVKFRWYQGTAEAFKTLGLESRAG
jgi:ketosteroid isomerase-like protein